MTAISRLVVVLGANSAEFVDELQKADRKAKGFAETATRNAKAAGAAILAMGATAAGALTAIAIASAKAADELAKTADKLGIATEELAGMQLAAKLTGVENNKLTMGLQRMIRRVAEAAQGTGEAQGALRELGLDAERLNQLSPDEQFRAIAEQMAKIPNQADKIRLGFKLFDSEGVDLIRTLSIGASGLDEATQKAKDYGVALTRVEAKQIEMATDAITEAKYALQGIGTQTALAFAPFVELVVSGFNDSARAAGGFKEEIQTAMLGVSQAIAVASNAGIHLSNFMDEIQRQAVKLRAALAPEEGGLLESLVEGVNTPQAAALRAQIDIMQQADAEVAEIEARIAERTARLVTPEQVEAMFDAAIAAQVKEAEAQLAALNLGGGDGLGMGGISDKDQQALTALSERLMAESELKLAQYEKDRELIEKTVEDETRKFELLRELDLEFFEWQRELAISQEEYDLEREEAWLKREEEDLERERAMAEERVRIEQEASNAILRLKEDVANRAVGLLQAFAGQSKGFAIAAIALEKAMSIKSILLNAKMTAAKISAQGLLGAQLAFNSQLIPGNPWSIIPATAAYASTLAQAQAAAAAALSTGTLAAGLEAATGLAQALSVGGGGAALGTPGNPALVETQPTSQAQQPAPTEITIHLVGDPGMPISPLWIRDGLIPAIDEALGDGVKVSANWRGG